MTEEMNDKLQIRELVERWAVWRDAGDWERFATVWHPEGVMMATWFQGSFRDFIRVTQEGWAKLTLRWALFFLAMAVLNEIVWRTQTTDVWVSFKLFGAVPLTLVFGALQYPLLTKYRPPDSGRP